MKEKKPLNYGKLRPGEPLPDEPKKKGFEVSDVVIRFSEENGMIKASTVTVKNGVTQTAFVMLPKIVKYDNYQDELSKLISTTYAQNYI